MEATGQRDCGDSPNGEWRIRFDPTSARDAPTATSDLCRRYDEAVHEERIPPLLIIATVVFDFLCVHPFRDGNGRVSRLISTLLLERHGFEVVRHVSLERLVEERKEEYYGVLRTCSEGWHEGKNEIVPWWNYFLGVLRSGYQEFEGQVESTGARPAKSELVRRIVPEQPGHLTFAEVVQQTPTVTPQLVRESYRGTDARRKDHDCQESERRLLALAKLPVACGVSLPGSGNLYTQMELP
ncbi:MAG: Fic family protein [Bryobacterales bacterium]|nr:Fic family protein [Bryobacterales bacterium]